MKKRKMRKNHYMKNGHTDVFTVLLQNNGNVQEKGENDECTRKREKWRNNIIHDSEER